MAKAAEAAEVAHGDSLLEQLEGLRAKVSEILEAAELADGIERCQ